MCNTDMPPMTNAIGHFKFFDSCDWYHYRDTRGALLLPLYFPLHRHRIRSNFYYGKSNFYKFLKSK